MTAVDVSVVVVNHNTADLLITCLRSIYEFPPEVRFEVFVVDNRSDDESIESVRRQFPPVRILPLQKNIGFGAAVNRALVLCQGRYALVLNPDARLLPGTLDALVTFADANPRAGCVGPRHVGNDERIQLTWGKFPTLRSEVVRKALHTTLASSNRRMIKRIEQAILTPCKVDWVSGSCMLVRREAWTKAGLLDENYFLYFEDIDWCGRMRDQGFAVHYLPDVRVVHRGGGSTERRRIDALLAYRASQFYFVRKHYGAFHSAAVRGLEALKSFVLLGAYLSVGRLIGGKGKASQPRLMAMIHLKILRLCLGRERGV